MTKHYALSFPIETVRWDGQYIRRLPEESYLPALQLLQSIGINEVMLAGYVTVEEADFDIDEETRRLGNLLDSLGMKAAQHHGLSPTYARLEESQEPVIEKFIKSVRWTSNLNASSLVIHPGHFLGKYDSSNCLVKTFEEQVLKHGLDAVIEICASNLRAAGKEAEKCGIKIALENVDRFEPFGNVELLPRMVKMADSPAVGFCFDSGHAHCCGQTELVKWIEVMGNKLFTTHFHDNAGARHDALSNKKWIEAKKIDAHLPPGFGTIPWIDVIQALNKINYANTVNFESGPWPDMPKEEGYRHAIAYWKTLEYLATKK